MILCFYFSIILLLVRGVFCNETAKWENSCKELGQNMQNLVFELDQLKNNEELEEIIEKINKLKEYSSQLSQIVRKDKHILLEPLIFEHAQKVGRFCEHLLMGEGLQREVISERLHHGIDQIKDRVVQIRQLMDTIFMDWKVWPILYNFELFVGPTDSLNKLIEQLRQKIGVMLEQIVKNVSYYNKDSFAQAMNNLTELAAAQDHDQIRKFGQTWKIIQNLMTKASSDMFENLSMDLLGPSSRFYGTNLLTEFAKQISFSEKICADANVLFEQRKSSIIDQINNIGKMLHNEMRAQQIVIGAGTTKRQILIQTLQNVQTVFGTVHNELDLLDLLDSSSIVKEKLDKLEQLLKLNIVKNGMPNDDVELSEEILSCLNTGEICKLIEQEGDNMINRILF